MRTSTEGIIVARVRGPVVTGARESTEETCVGARPLSQYRQQSAAREGKSIQAPNPLAPRLEGLNRPSRRECLARSGPKCCRPAHSSIQARLLVLNAGREDVAGESAAGPDPFEEIHRVRCAELRICRLNCAQTSERQIGCGDRRAMREQ